jgi:hypothetical protein
LQSLFCLKMSPPLLFVLFVVKKIIHSLPTSLSALPLYCSSEGRRRLSQSNNIYFDPNLTDVVIKVNPFLANIFDSNQSVYIKNSYNLQKGQPYTYAYSFRARDKVWT